MNLVFVQGKIVSNVEFKFIINNRNKSIAIFKLELSNKSIIKVKAYNKLADFCYSKLNKGDLIFIQGYSNSKVEIIANTVCKLNVNYSN